MITHRTALIAGAVGIARAGATTVAAHGPGRAAPASASGQTEYA